MPFEFDAIMHVCPLCCMALLVRCWQYQGAGDCVTTKIFQTLCRRYLKSG